MGDVIVSSISLAHHVPSDTSNIRHIIGNVRRTCHWVSGCSCQARHKFAICRNLRKFPTGHLLSVCTGQRNVSQSEPRCIEVAITCHWLILQATRSPCHLLQLRPGTGSHCALNRNWPEQSTCHYAYLAKQRKMCENLRSNRSSSPVCFSDSTSCNNSHLWQRRLPGDTRP